MKKNPVRGPEAKILLVDLETAPNLGWVWGKWEQDVIDFEKGWYILSFAYKWHGDKKVTTHALPDYKNWKKDKEDDYTLVQELWKLFDAAHIIVAHNGDAFDIKKANARFITHRLGPPSPYRTYDTLKAARRITSNNSNKLDDLGAVWHLGRKLPHTGKHLWLGCMQGDMKAWATMRAYNAQDVTLLEKLYLLLRPWDRSHPNINVVSRDPHACPSCGSHHLIKWGYNYTRTSEAQRYKCLNCGAWSSGKPEPLANKVYIR